MHLGKPKSSVSKKQTSTPGLLIDVSGKTGKPVHVKGLIVHQQNGSRDIKVFPLTGTYSMLPFKYLPAAVYAVVEAFAQEKIFAAWQKNYPLQKAIAIHEVPYKQLRNHQYGLFSNIKPYVSLITWFYQAVDDMLITTTVLKPAVLSNYLPVLSFVCIRLPHGRIRILAMVNINDVSYHASDFKQHDFLLQCKAEFFLLKPEDADTLGQFPNGFMDTTEKEWPVFMQQVVQPLATRYEVNTRAVIKVEEVETQPQCKLYLSELNNSFLMLRMHWQYGDYELENTPEQVTVLANETGEIHIKRALEEEQTILGFIRSCHKKFEQQRNDYFYLSFDEAAKSQWFVKFYRKLIDKDIPVYGMEHLQHFRYNLHTPVITVTHKGNGIDWFDLQVTIAYGDEQVALADLQKAIFNRQSFLLLKDGTIGAIPEEWLTQYALLFRLGKTDKNSLRLSKVHWSVLQSMGGDDTIANQVIPLSQREKWNRVQEADESVFELPKQINASLRDYQKAGYNWMALLDEMQWGGCLADDMGLGKTLQTITFLQHIVNKYPDEKHLIICPTSLLYNWENELKKFAPQLTFIIHHGPQRVCDITTWQPYNIIISSYGTVRSDIELLQDYFFGYIVLDESHSIKNPVSQVTKAVQLLQSRNRIILSGTPIQNNTFDLYAQMHFLNPGLLGSREFFKAEFANPIDKFGNKEKAAQLRKIIYPFLLRRTKEQVAKDLPSKTEITLWCEMGAAQRKVYDAVKNYYRDSLLNRIEQEGVGKNAIYILEGLTRLRQVCNAPQLLKDENIAITESVKMDELLSELEENIGNHKVLVFSQFTGMLQLIARAMEERFIPYLYLDGGTPADKRNELVQQFQTKADEQVFLISLKAGGVGLTLTAADYVYLVDPWWNPAAEQQAIDRTHRIGQQNKVFAYKMICKDTVEEKILALQERKKSLADDLISEETGFVKKLTADDISFLFS